MPVDSVKLRATKKLPAAVAKRMTYRTRHLVAEGDVFDVPPSDARTFLKAGWAEKADEDSEPVRRGPGRPPKAQAQETAPEQDEPESESAEEP